MPSLQILAREAYSQFPIGDGKKHQGFFAWGLAFPKPVPEPAAWTSRPAAQCPPPRPQVPPRSAETPPSVLAAASSYSACCRIFFPPPPALLPPFEIKLTSQKPGRPSQPIGAQVIYSSELKVRVCLATVGRKSREKSHRRCSNNKERPKRK